MTDSPVWLVIGIQAAGKTTVASLLAREFDRGVHVLDRQAEAAVDRDLT